MENTRTTINPEERCERCDLMYIAEDRTSANVVEQLNSAPVQERYVGTG
jgi:hypothetical protein